MSNEQRKENLPQIIQTYAPDFNKLAQIHGAVTFEREASFALQILKDNDYLMGIALANPDSLKNAVLNVAAIGLSLSPVHKLAYLLPRKKKICLDISYRGLVQLATDVGAIMWAQAEVVCEKDTFEHAGVGLKPIHRFDPFAKDRGEPIGAYCVAKTHDGEFLTTVMSADEIMSVRDRSESWQAHVKEGKKTPWKTDTNEMIKKTVIRRAYKTWPMTDSRKRFDQAIDVGLDADPVDVNGQRALPESQRAKEFAAIRSMLSFLGKSEEKYVSHLATVCRREIKAIEDLTDIEIDQQTVMLGQWVEAKEKRDANANAG
jgi:recombination protein RecT